MKTIILIGLFIVISLSIARSVVADVVPRVINIYDENEEFSFGVLARIPIDSNFITNPICLQFARSVRR